MVIYDGIRDFPRLNYPVVTSGTFDGVHKGHQKILNRIKEISRRERGETVLLTFWPHPRMILNPNDHGIQLLTTFEEKAALLKEIGIDHLVKIQFTKSFSNLTSQEFVKQFLVEAINTKKLVIGYDHHFGKNREGSFQYLSLHQKQFGFEVEEIPKQDLDDVAISSSIIRKSLSNGKVELAARYLGYLYTISGKVITGNKLGRSLGFPTANILVHESAKLIPGDGVYAVKVKVDDHSYGGMMNIGFRPTLDGSKKSIEVHIFEFDREIYGKEIDISFIDFIRHEQKFDGPEALKTQLENDKSQALKILAKG